MGLSYTEVASAWIGNGGARNRAVEFVAIGIAESGLDQSAISSVGALGLWQIMPANFTMLGLDLNAWQDPGVNARAAVLLSGGGANCAPWDSCYDDIYTSGRYSSLNWPEPQSAAAGNLGPVSAVLKGGFYGGATAPAYPGLSGDMTGAIAAMNAISGRAVPAAVRDLGTLGMRLSRMYTPRWR